MVMKKKKKSVSIKLAQEVKKTSLKKSATKPVKSLKKASASGIKKPNSTKEKKSPIKPVSSVSKGTAKKKALKAVDMSVTKAKPEKLKKALETDSSTKVVAKKKTKAKPEKLKKALETDSSTKVVAKKKTKAKSEKLKKALETDSSTKVVAKKKTKAKPKQTAAQKKELKLLEENEKKWELLYKKAKSIKPVKFDIKLPFLSKTPLNHVVFGWGWIIESKNNRLEVIFKDKVRMLFSNQSAPGKQAKTSKKVSKKK